MSNRADFMSEKMSGNDVSGITTTMEMKNSVEINTEKK